jgi:hypothetical protein
MVSVQWRITVEPRTTDDVTPPSCYTPATLPQSTRGRSEVMLVLLISPERRRRRATARRWALLFPPLSSVIDVWGLADSTGAGGSRP